MKGIKLDRQVKQYLIQSIDLSGYDYDINSIEGLKEVFYAEMGWNVDRVGLQRAIEEWLMGLPSSMNIVFYNWDIIDLAKKWGSLPENATEKQEDKILENYWNLLAGKLVQLFNDAEIEVEA